MAKTGGIEYLQQAFTFANTTSFHIGWLPPNAYITDVKVLVPTDFTDGVLDVGDTTTAAAFADDVSLNGTGSKTVTSTAQWGSVQSTTDQTEVKGIVVFTSTAPGVGAGKVVVEYAFNE
jgi:hypothetical protein